MQHVCIAVKEKENNQNWTRSWVLFYVAAYERSSTAEHVFKLHEAVTCSIDEALSENWLYLQLPAVKKT